MFGWYAEHINSCLWVQAGTARCSHVMITMAQSAKFDFIWILDDNWGHVKARLANSPVLTSSQLRRLLQAGPGDCATLNTVACSVGSTEKYAKKQGSQRTAGEPRRMRSRCMPMMFQHSLPTSTPVPGILYGAMTGWSTQALKVDELFSLQTVACPLCDLETSVALLAGKRSYHRYYRVCVDKVPGNGGRNAHYGGSRDRKIKTAALRTRIFRKAVRLTAGDASKRALVRRLFIGQIGCKKQFLSWEAKKEK